MKWIKLFEGFDELMYQEIDKEEGMFIIKEKSVSMSKKNSDKILSYPFKKLKNGVVASGDPESHSFVESGITKGHKFLDITTEYMSRFYNLEIVEADDEWFIVRIHGELKGFVGELPVPLQPRQIFWTFKCDQIDGLFELLKKTNL